MKLFLVTLLLLTSSVAIAADNYDKHSHLPLITVIALYNGPGIPDGWVDSTTRPDATEVCNKLIASQSRDYANAISNSRCIIQVHEDE